MAAHALKRDRAWVLAHGEAIAPSKKLEVLLERRLTREPLAYILGYREFFGRKFLVDRRVLIPRQETETLVEAVLDCLPRAPFHRVLDLGTGSGCVAITVALERPDIEEVFASDKSEDALRLVRANTKRLGTKVRFGYSDGLDAAFGREMATIVFVRSDLFDGLEGARFSIIATNPPYVAEGSSLQPEVGEWEPAEALYAGASGLRFFERLAKEAGEYLRPGGLLLTEVGDGQADAAAQVFEKEGWIVVKRVKDLIGHERLLVLANRGLVT